MLVYSSQGKIAQFRLQKSFSGQDIVDSSILAHCIHFKLHVVCMKVENLVGIPWKRGTGASFYRSSNGGTWNLFIIQVMRKVYFWYFISQTRNSTVLMNKPICFYWFSSVNEPQQMPDQLMFILNPASAVIGLWQFVESCFQGAHSCLFPCARNPNFETLPSLWNSSLTYPPMPSKIPVQRTPLPLEILKAVRGIHCRYGYFLESPNNKIMLTAL